MTREGRLVQLDEGRTCEYRIVQLASARTIAAAGCLESRHHQPRAHVDVVSAARHTHTQVFFHSVFHGLSHKLSRLFTQYTMLHMNKVHQRCVCLLGAAAACVALASRMELLCECSKSTNTVRLTTQTADQTEHSSVYRTKHE
jgi:hypothetical protein